MTTSARILLIADTHIGFDHPFRPRIERRRRGPDFLANFEKALEPALRGKVDLVVHGGDLFFRSKVPPALIDIALTPLLKVAQAGIPVFVVPGNHERSRIPQLLWTRHPNLKIFDKPKTFAVALPGLTLSLSGFPFARKIRDTFTHLVAATGYQKTAADYRLLCLHQAVEGAQVGPANFTFRRGADVIRGGDIPGDFAAVLTGHIHRSQILRRDLKNKPLAAPVIYPGSVERTAFAERFEEKHYALVDVGSQVEVNFVRLPARPMVILELDKSGLDKPALLKKLGRKFKALDPNAVVQVRLQGSIQDENSPAVSAADLRSLAPSTMNVSLVLKQNHSSPN